MERNRLFEWVIILALVACLVTYFAKRSKAPQESLEGLVLWNTLDSEAAIVESHTGPAGIYQAKDGRFVNGISGQALQLSHDDYAAALFPKDVISVEAGAIEFWARLEELPEDIGWGQKPVLIQIHDGESTFGLHFNGNDGHGNGGLCGWAGVGGHCGTKRSGDWTYAKVLGDDAVNGWHHYALVWDQNGIAGLEGDWRFAVFLDGQINSDSWRRGEPTEFKPLAGGELTLLVKHTPMASGTITFDEIKVWDYAKTDFNL